MRLVLDTNTVISALLFTHGQLSWLREHWRSKNVVTLVSKPTVDELIRVLTYPKFDLDKVEIEALLADYLPFTEAIAVSSQPQSPLCRNLDDQMFVDLAIEGRADVLITGDRALLAMNFGVVIENAAHFRRRLEQ